MAKKNQITSMTGFGGGAAEGIATGAGRRVGAAGKGIAVLPRPKQES